MAKIRTTVSEQKALISRYERETGHVLGSSSVKENKSEDDLQEIGCRKFRLGTNIVTVVKWSDRFSTVHVVVYSEFKDGKVRINNKPSIYKWPFHGIYSDFEVLDDINYLEKMKAEDFFKKNKK